MTIIESPEYAADAKALLDSQHLYNMYVGLPTDVQEKLAAGEHISGFMQAANAEWNRRNDATDTPHPAPRFLGSVERALRIIATTMEEASRLLAEREQA